MGYTTDFKGGFKINKPLREGLKNYLTKFSETRRMKRKLDDKFGVEGEFYVDGGGYAGQDRESNIIDYNSPPKTQPGLWCQWIPNEDGTEIVWDGGEKFYEYVAWLEYIIKNFLEPEGYVLNGEVYFQGEYSNDNGVIVVTYNKVEIE